MTPALPELVNFNARNISNVFTALRTLEGLKKLAIEFLVQMVSEVYAVETSKSTNREITNH